MQIKMVQLQNLADDRGNLVSLEGNKNVPFDIRRVYYLFGTKSDVRRGFHAHKRLKQLIVAVKGSCRILLDDGRERAEVLLDDPRRGLIVEFNIWREMFDFSEDCVLMVLADAHYDEDDYIRDYKTFINMNRSEANHG
jgi:dTDP-4-dehydrorhamnose 3,5-epimerase-like enzyme